MRAKIQKQFQNLFNPYFNTVIMGQVTKVSLSDAQQNAEKYVNTPIGPLYEDFKELKEKVMSRNKTETVKLDMNDAQRGDLFSDEYKSKKKDSIDKFKSEQKRLQERISKRVQKNLESREAQEQAHKKAVADALKKERAKIKREETKAKKTKEKAD